MALSRRDFVKLCSGTVAGFGVSQMFHPAIHEAFAQTLTGERPPVFWVQGQGCTGCSVTLLNSTHPSIADVLLKIISLEFHPTVMAAEGEGAYEHMMRVAEKFKGKFIFAVEGAVPVAHDGKCCVVAEANHHEVTMTEVTKVLAANAAAVLAVGTCAAYGGIPAGKGNETGAMGVSAFLKKEGIPAPVINIPRLSSASRLDRGHHRPRPSGSRHQHARTAGQAGARRQRPPEGVLQERAHELSPPERI